MADAKVADLDTTDDMNEDSIAAQLARQKRLSRMSAMDIVHVLLATLMLYARIIVDLILAAVYFAGIPKSSELENWGQEIVNGFVTFVLVLLPGIIMLINTYYTRYPEEDVEGFKKMVRENGLFNLPYFFPENFDYGSFQCCNRFMCRCCLCCVHVSETLFLKIISALQIRPLHDCIVSLTLLWRTTGGWRDAILCSVTFHAAPQVLYQCYHIYFTDAATSSIETFGYQGRVIRYCSVVLNLLAVSLIPNHAPMFDATFRVTERANCGMLCSSCGGTQIAEGEESDLGDDDSDVEEEHRKFDHGSDAGDLKHGESDDKAGDIELVDVKKSPATAAADAKSGLGDDVPEASGEAVGDAKRS